MPEQSETTIEDQWWFPLVAWPVMVLVIGPLQLARPCGPARNCISWRTAAVGVAGSAVWATVAWTLLTEVGFL